MNLQKRRCACGQLFGLVRLMSRETACVPCQRAQSARLSAHGAALALAAYFGHVRGWTRRTFAEFGRRAERSPRAGTPGAGPRDRALRAERLRTPPPAVVAVVVYPKGYEPCR